MLMASSHALVRKNRSRDSFLLVWTGRLVLLVSSVVNTASPHPNLRSYVRESGYRYIPSLTTLGLGTFIEDDLRSRM